MSPAATNIATQINQFIRTYPLDWGTNLNLNRILLLILQLADTNSAGGSGSNGVIFPINSSNFSNATDCPLASLVNAQFRLYWGEGQKFLETDLGEWQTLVGGGFRVLIPGFNSTTQNYHFYIFIQGGTIAESGSDTSSNVTLVTSGNFINATDCPITPLNGDDLEIYYNEGGRFLDLATGEWAPLSGGGFRVLLSGFDSSKQNYHFYVFKTA